MIRKLVQDTARGCGRVQRVGIIGGMHGNELSGVSLVRGWMDDSSFVRRASFDTAVEFGNPRAVEKCLRYIDIDLNRCFSNERLSQNISSPETPYEVKRAQELNKIFGPKGTDEAFDVVIDLHNTTSNMGVTLMPASANDVFMLQMAHYVNEHSDVKVPVLITEQPQLFNEMATAKYVPKHGLTLEIGPQTHGTLQYGIYKAMKDTVSLLLDFIELYNSGKSFDASTIEIFRIKKIIDFPRCSKGHPSAMIYPKLHEKNWQPLRKGDPIFVTMDGDILTYQEDETVYPAFVGEAAYYEKKTAFWVTQKEIIDMPPLQIAGHS